MAAGAYLCEQSSYLQASEGYQVSSGTYWDSTQENIGQSALL